MKKKEKNQPQSSMVQ